MLPARRASLEARRGLGTSRRSDACIETIVDHAILVTHIGSSLAHGFFYEGRFASTPMCRPKVAASSRDLGVRHDEVETGFLSSAIAIGVRGIGFEHEHVPGAEREALSADFDFDCAAKYRQVLDGTCGVRSGAFFGATGEA
jgi:hypothetical protein